MNIDVLKFNLTLLFSILLFMNIQAQQNRFIYIQAENQKPFYIKLAKKYLSSSSSGYIIIPQLKDSMYDLTIGSPKNDWPEQNITISLKVSNAGFLVKNTGGTNWDMMNLQTLQLLKPVKQTKSVIELETKNSTDDFAVILAQVVNDPSIAQIPLEKNVVERRIGAIVTPVKNEQVIPVENNLESTNRESSKTKISKLQSDSAGGGLKITYLEIINKKADTITVFIPIKETVLKAELENKTAILEVDPKTTPKTKLNKMQTQMKDTGRSISKVNDKITNSDCKSIATQNAFLKLRKQMAAKESENDMTKLAIKTFTSACFTTEQIKSLGVLYIKEEERYKFYVAAYPFVSDSHNFGTLEDQLTDNYYITRFKAMLIH